MSSSTLIALLGAAAVVSVAGLNVKKGPFDPEVAVANETAAPKVYAYDPAPVFYSVFMGEYSGRHQARLWMSSLRKVGKWKGTIMMTTDKGECLANVLGEDLLGGKMEYSDDDVTIYPGTGPTGRVHIVHGKSKHAGGGLMGKEFKRQKQLVWNHTDEAQFNHEVSSVVYTDEDIVFGKDLTDAMKDIRETEKHHYTLSLFQDQGHSSGELHTGIVVSYPTNRSKACLAGWMKTLKHYVPLGMRPKGPKSFSREIANATTESLETPEWKGFDNPKFDLLKTTANASATMEGIDQQSLGVTYKCNRHINSLEPKFLKMPDKSSCEDGVGAEFVHFTNTYRAKGIPKPTQEKYFYDHLGLSRSLDVFGTTQC